MSQPSGKPDGPAGVFLAFLRLGLTAFGGPVAHLGYFHEAFVERRRWLAPEAYAELVALCQFLPGPASSQVGFALGLHRAGLGGALAAFAGFTLPSALVMLAAAGGLAYIDPAAHGGLVHGLKLAAVGVVAWALWGLARRLTPDPRRLAIGLVALACALAIPAIAGQLFALGAGAVLAPWLVPYQEVPRGVRLSVPLGRGGAIAALALFAILLAGLPLLASAGPAAALADAMYRAGALVFGGGHVVLPLLHAQTVVPGLLPADTFLAGYGLAQALPGPLFTFGGFVGAAAGGVAAGLLALVAIFLPGFLLLLAVLPFWQAVRASTRVRRHLAGVNAAVVGVLGAALYDPVLTSGIRHWADVAIAAAVVAGLASGRVPPWLLVLACGLAGWLLY